MEKSRAIELLKLAVPIKALTQQEYADFVEAVNMGMDALEQPTSPDTIDRQAALDALRRCQTYLYDARDPELKIELSSADAAIKELPTIQPEKAQLSKEGATSDTISRQAAIEAVDSETVITNPEHFKSNEKFIKFMDDSDISSFGKWQWANGFNTALVATRIHLKKLPSAQPEYEPVTAEDFAKTMSENTLYNFMAWNNVAFTLMNEMGFVICKKTM